jgi:D-aminoacyl-tRNA deacylase
VRDGGIVPESEAGIGAVYEEWNLRSVIQRVAAGSVRIGDEIVASIGPGLVVLAAVEKGDSDADIAAAAKKIREIRIFSDASGKMNLSVAEAGGEILAVSQFTLAASLERGRRPSFDRAEEPERAKAMFERFVRALGEEGTAVRTGVFGAMMAVSIENDGPVTFVHDTR